jgi:hypothetical protein
LELPESSKIDWKALIAAGFEAAKTRSQPASPASGGVFLVFSGPRPSVVKAPVNNNRCHSTVALSCLLVFIFISTHPLLQASKSSFKPTVQHLLLLSTNALRAVPCFQPAENWIKNLIQSTMIFQLDARERFRKSQVPVTIALSQPQTLFLCLPTRFPCVIMQMRLFAK